MRARFADERGVSLVELSVGSFLAIVLALGVLQFFDSSVERAVGIEQRSQRQAAVRVGVDELVRDLRQAWTGDPATPPVSAVSGTTITFFTPDRSTPVRLRRVSYRISGDELQRSIARSTNAGGPPWTFAPAGPWATVVDSLVAGPLFTAVDDAGTATNDPSRVRRVDVRVAVDGSRGGADNAYRTSIELRNAR